MAGLEGIGHAGWGGKPEGVRHSPRFRAPLIRLLGLTNDITFGNPGSD